MNRTAKQKLAQAIRLIIFVNLIALGVFALTRREFLTATFAGMCLLVMVADCALRHHLANR